MSKRVDLSYSDEFTLGGLSDDEFEAMGGYEGIRSLIRFDADDVVESDPYAEVATYHDYLFADYVAANGESHTYLVRSDVEFD